MNPSICNALVLATVIFQILPAARAQSLDQIGVTLLRATTTNLNGSGIRVAQPEASFGGNPPIFEVNPGAVGQPASLFTYISTVGTASTYPNLVGSESGHADSVGGLFYGLAGGVATNTAHVDNYDAGYFYNNIIAAILPANINASVANQSFIFCNADFSHFDVSTEQGVDSQYDDYAAQYKTLFVSGAGNGGPTNQAIVYPPATCYNGLGVAADGGTSCTGPTLDNGRCKPDITAPASATSYSTPQVSGAAAVLMQAALRGDGGSDTNSATDLRTIKALLLNGAVKPANWTNSTSFPLDARYGAGVLNVFNSYQQLAGGKRGWNFSTNIPTGTAHPPVAMTNAIAVLSGWDFSTNSSSIAPARDHVNHYFFNISNGVAPASFTATATLVWNRQQSQTDINNLDLFLYNCASSNLVACSTSLVDNVEHLFVPNLAPGRYDLQVWKEGGLSIVSAAEPYALAFAFTSQTLALAKAGTNLNLTWSYYPAGFVVEANTNLLSSGGWSTNQLPPTIFTNGQNTLRLNATNAVQFFRLRQP